MKKKIVPYIQYKELHSSSLWKSPGFGGNYKGVADTDERKAAEDTVHEGVKQRANCNQEDQAQVIHYCHHIDF